jgi:hypothetical protein
MAISLAKVESQEDYAGVGKLVDLQMAVVDTDGAITYAAGGVELDLASFSDNLVTGDLLAVYGYVKGAIAESNIVDYKVKYNHSTNKLQIYSLRTSANGGTAEAGVGSITTTFRLVLFFVEPGTNA